MGSRTALSAKQQRFAEEYCIDFNGTQAAIRAGYARRSAQVAGSRQLLNDMVTEKIWQRMEVLSQVAGVRAKRILQEIGYIAFADIRELFDKAGSPLPLQDVAEKTRRAVASFRVTERAVKDSKGNDVVERVFTVRMWDKNRALDMLAKHLGLYREGASEALLRAKGALDMVALKSMSVDDLRRTLDIVAGSKGALLAGE